MRHQTPSHRSLIVVRTLSARATTGVMQFGPMQMRCALGRSGKRISKREGDGASPVGAYPLREVYIRRDRLARPKTALTVRTLSPNDGWCDASADRNYNRFVTHPYPSSAEQLWRSDGLYDIVVVIGYNDTVRVANRGSAIFLHCARPNTQPTEGCIAVARPDLLRLIGRMTKKTKLLIS